MPRFHRINGMRVQFTDAEEVSRDAEEEALVKEMEESDRVGLARTELAARIASDNATLTDVLAYLRG